MSSACSVARSLYKQAIWQTPLLNRVLRQIANTAELSFQTTGILSGQRLIFRLTIYIVETRHIDYRLIYFKSVENNIFIKEFVAYIYYRNLIGIREEY